MCQHSHAEVVHQTCRLRRLRLGSMLLDGADAADRVAQIDGLVCVTRGRMVRTVLPESQKEGEMSDEINRGRRRFLGAAAMTIAAAELGMMRSARGQSKERGPADAARVKRSASGSFAALKQMEAGLLSAGYAEAGAASGPAVVL